MERGPGSEKGSLVLLLVKNDYRHKDFAAVTAGWMCRKAAVEFDVYYPSHHGHGGLFAPLGSNVIGGQHAMRIGRALSTYQTVVIRLGEVSIFASLIEHGADRVIDLPEDLLDFYAALSKELHIAIPSKAVAIEDKALSPAVYFPECVYREALAVPLNMHVDSIQRLRDLGMKTVYTIAGSDADVSAYRNAGFEVKSVIDLSGPDPNYEVARRWIDRAAAVDTLEPTLGTVP